MIRGLEAETNHSDFLQRLVQFTNRTDRPPIDREPKRHISGRLFVALALGLLLLGKSGIDTTPVQAVNSPGTTSASVGEATATSVPAGEPEKGGYGGGGGGGRMLHYDGEHYVTPQ